MSAFVYLRLRGTYIKGLDAQEKITLYVYMKAGWMCSENLIRIPPIEQNSVRLRCDSTYDLRSCAA